MFRVRTEWAGWPGSPALSTLYFADDGGQTAQNAANAAQAFWQALSGRIMSSSTWSIDTAVDTMTTAGVVTGTTAVTGTLTGVGSATGHSLPPATQGLIRWRTGSFTGGREIRGRTFIPTPSENDSDFNPTSGYISTLNTAAAALIADANSQLVVWSKTNTLIANATVGQAWTSWAVLRSRRDS